MNRRELATILAALRFWQHALDTISAPRFHAVRDFEIEATVIACDSGRFDPLNAREIDRLCARLSIGDSTR